MKRVLLGLLCFLALEVFSAEEIKVGVYDFPPYAFVTNDVTGITVQVIAAMNAFQQEYNFVLVPTTARRRYLDFSNDKFDMLIFESKEWGWQSYPLDVSHTFVTGAEVYVALAKTGRDQGFFTDFKNKAMIGVLGYHYRFANFRTDQDYLAKNFSLIQTDGQERSLELILKGRGEIAVLTKEYLNYHFLAAPRDKNRLLISDKYDQIYRHTILVRHNHSLTIQKINQLLKEMTQANTLKPIWDKYGLSLPE